MSRSLEGLTLGILALLLLIAMPVPAVAAPMRGEAIGPLAATVARVDSPRGLIVRSEPLPTGRALGHLGMGARISSYNEFRNGWVKLQSPIDGGWVEMAALKPALGNGVVISVDRPEMCLRIRSGPGASYGLVGCAQKGDRIRLTGLGSQNNWAEIDRPVRGWVTLSQISTNPGLYRSLATIPPQGDVYVDVPPPGISTYVAPYGGFYGSGPYYGDYYYRRPGVAVRVGPRGGVAVSAGGVGVRVGPRGGVGVRVR